MPDGTMQTASDLRATLAYILLWGALITYALMISIDVGAGAYRWLAGLRGASARRSPERREAERIARTYLTPVWEVTNVFLVLFVVGMVGFFPPSAQIFGVALLIPGSLATAALAVRGAAIAFEHLSGEGRLSDWLRGVSALAGLAALPLLVTFLSSAESGAIRLGADGQVIVSQVALWFSPQQVALGALAVALAFYLGAAFLAGFAARQGALGALRYYRARAWRAGIITSALALIFADTLALTAPQHALALARAWPAQALIVALDITALLALRSQRPGGARLGAWGALATAGLVLGVFGLTRLPWLFAPSLTVAQALTPPATFDALMVTVIAGVALLAPSLWLLYRLFFGQRARTHSPTSAVGRRRASDARSAHGAATGR